MRPSLRVVGPGLPAVVLLGLLAATSGCGYPSYAFVNPGSPDDDAGDSSVPGGDSSSDGDVRDAASETSDSAIVDTSPALDSAPSDTGAPDSMPADTTSADAPDGADAHPLGCAGSTAVFCADFDSVTSPSDGWTGSFLAGGGAIALDSIGDSPPSSMLATIPNTTATEAGAAVYYTRDVPTSSSTARVDLDLFLDVATYPTGVLLLKLQRPGGKGKGVGVGIASDGVYVEVIGTTSNTYSALAAAPVGRWFHLRLEAQLLVTGAHVRLWIDDPATPVFDRGALSSADVDGLTELLNIGLYTNGSSITSYQAHYDDVELSYP